jgi:lysophospholipase L1-like esterase
MSDTTPNLRLPYIQAAQAQKHVTHNEAIRALDALIQIAVASRTQAAAPASPTEGARFIVPAAAAGPWTGFSPHIAAFQDGAWVKYTARAGWLVWVEDEDRLYSFDGTAWIVAGGQSLNPAPHVGVNATADDTNRLAVSSPASLFNHEGSDHRAKINKAAAGDTASLLFQTGYSGRAEVGLTGDDNLHLKVSADGMAWKEAMVVDRNTGAVSFPFNSPWQGRKWAALGTSITSEGYYTGPLATLLGATLTNLGVSGGHLSVPASGGSGLEIYNAIGSIPSDADLVTLEPAINDFGRASTLGTIGDTTTATFYGALLKAGQDILAANALRVLVYLTPYAISTTGYPSGANWNTANANGNTLVQFQQAVRDVAHRLGCPVIDLAESNIGAQTASAYLPDGLHVAAAGGVRLAQFIYDRLLFVRPATVAVATPTFSPAAGTYYGTQSVAISCATSGATIHYTTDGSTPTTSSAVYSGAISVAASQTIKALAVKSGLTNSSVGAAAYTISASFSPSSLSPAMWFDASDLTKLFQDTGGTTAVASDGDAIGLIQDKSGNSRHLTQSSSGSRPVYKTSAGLSWFEFDGSRTALLASRFTTNPGDFAVAWVSRKDNVSEHGVVAGVGGSQTWAGDNVLGGTSPTIEYQKNTSGTGQVEGGFNTASVLADHVSIVNVTAGVLQTYQNGVAGNANASADAATLSLDGLTFGAGGYIYSGRIYQFLVFPHALTSGEISDLTTWLKAKAGIA